MGVMSGKNIRASWFQHMLLALLFLIGTWIFFDIGETAFIKYATVYVVLGYVVMLLTALISKNKLKEA